MKDSKDCSLYILIHHAWPAIANTVVLNFGFSMINMHLEYFVVLSFCLEGLISFCRGIMLLLAAKYIFDSFLDKNRFPFLSYKSYQLFTVNT